MRISDWSSDVCSSDLDLQLDRHDVGRFDELQDPDGLVARLHLHVHRRRRDRRRARQRRRRYEPARHLLCRRALPLCAVAGRGLLALRRLLLLVPEDVGRSEEHTSELQSLMRISYAVFCSKKKTKTTHECYSQCIYI